MIAAPVAQVAPLPSDVVVTAERLHRLRLSLSMQDGRLGECTVRVGSGDPRIDAVACEAAAACVAAGTVRPEPVADCVNAHVARFVDTRAADAAATK